MNDILELASCGSCIEPQVSLQKLTTFRVGGPAAWLATPRTQGELEQSLVWANAAGLPVTLLGAGSNLLISDLGLPGLVICTRHWRQSTFDDVTGQVTAAAGEPLPTLAWKAAKRGWRGLEWAAGIPGTVGGAVVMNAGAHGGCTADILVVTQVLEPIGTISPLRPDDLAFQYRTSVLQGAGRVVLTATFALDPGHDPQAVMADTLAGLNQRRATQPYDLPSCGSVFRNPYPHTAGALIEQTGLKGYRIGNAQVAKRHANFILNCGGATATEIYQLIGYVQSRVADRWGLWLQPEVKLLGEFPPLAAPLKTR
ncbi:MAG: UDP-N-acetylmuramate dehydrogenase [Nodosilinea sp.]